MHTETVQLNYLNIAPRKVRLIGNTLKGMSVTNAQAQLMLRPQRAALALHKLLMSAVANVKHNKQISADALVVRQVIVNPAPVLKRALPRAQGRATSIFKRMSHVILILDEVASQKQSRFVMPVIEKKSKKTEEKKKPLPSRKATKEEKQADLEHSKPEKKLTSSKENEHEAASRKPANRGAVKRFFNRKSI